MISKDLTDKFKVNKFIQNLMKQFYDNLIIYFYLNFKNKIIYKQTKIIIYKVTLWKLRF